ncbi:hypothetical protein HOY82DRAFT_556930 [Tuber indicum]|nr:hypothetical protein HOY82DRAFT_556930 [Tuber indicum]
MFSFILLLNSSSELNITNISRLTPCNALPPIPSSLPSVQPTHHEHTSTPSPKQAPVSAGCPHPARHVTPFFLFAPLLYLPERARSFAKHQFMQVHPPKPGEDTGYANMMFRLGSTWRVRGEWGWSRLAGLVTGTVGVMIWTFWLRWFDRANSGHGLGPGWMIGLWRWGHEMSLEVVITIDWSWKRATPTSLRSVRHLPRLVLVRRNSARNIAGYCVWIDMVSPKLPQIEMLLA